VQATSGGSLFTFGVVTATPTLSIVSGGTNIGSNAQIGITTTTARIISFSATSTSGLAFPTNFVVGTLQVVTPTGTYCAAAADVNGSGMLTGVSTTSTTPPCPTVAFSVVAIDPTTARAGVYTLSAQARDVAGNLSSTFTRSFVIDRTAPAAANAVATTAPLSGGASEVVAAQATDNLGLLGQTALVDYPTASELVLQYNGATLGTALTTPFTTSTNLSVTIPSFVRAIALQSQTGANQFVNVSNQTFTAPTGIAVGASDQGANWGYATLGGVSSLLDQTQTTPTFFGGAGGPLSASITFQPSTANAATAGGFAATLASATSGTPTSETINLVLNGAPNTPFANPFAKVELYVRSTIPGNVQGVNPFTTSTAYTLAGTFGGASMSVSAGGSTITSSFNVVPGSNGIATFPSSGTTSVDLLVLATSASGYSIAFIIPTITLNP
jgi:large repetitive protein